MTDASLLDAVLDSWDRNNRILINLLRAIPAHGIDLTTSTDGHTVAELFTHINFCRLITVQEDAPEFAPVVPKDEWEVERDVVILTDMLNASAQAVRDAVQDRVVSGGRMAMHYDHPILLIQHMIWHEGYHHGQIKLALKQAGFPIPNEVAGPATWDVWMNKSDRA